MLAGVKVIIRGLELRMSGRLPGSCFGQLQVSVECSYSMLTPVEGTKRHTKTVEEVKFYMCEKINVF